MLYNLKRTLNIIKQASKYNKKFVSIKLNSNNIEILNFLYREGFINYYYINNDINLILVNLNNNTNNSKSLIRNFKFYTKGKRIIRKYSLKSLKLRRYQLLDISNSSEFKVFLTSKGLLSLDDCLYLGVGGFLVFSIEY